MKRRGGAGRGNLPRWRAADGRPASVGLLARTACSGRKSSGTFAWAVMLCGDMEAAAAHAARRSRSSPDPAGTLSSPRSWQRPQLQSSCSLAGSLRDDRPRIGLEGSDPDTPIEWPPSMMLGMILNWSGATVRGASPVRRSPPANARCERGDATSLSPRADERSASR